MRDLLRIVLLSLLLPLVHAPAANAGVVPTGNVVPIGTAVSALHPIDLAWTGSRFAIVSVESEAVPPAPVLLRFLDPFSDAPTAPVELTKTGAMPQVAAFPDGSLVVVWSDYEDWFVSFIDADGVPTGDAVPLELPEASAASIAAGSQGEWVFVFQRSVEASQSVEVAGMRFHGTTKDTEEPFAIGGSTIWPAAAMLPDNHFLAAWKETIWNEGCDDCGEDCCYDWHQTFVNGRGFDADGTARNDTHFLGSFHNDEAGLNGFAIARNGSTAFAGAWIDTLEMDYEGPAYVVLQAIDGDGNASGGSKVLEEVNTDPEGAALSVSSGHAVVATMQSEFNEEAGVSENRIDVYSTDVAGGPVEKLTLPTPALTFEWSPLLAASDHGAVLLVWETNNDLSPTVHLVAQPFFAASTIVCGDATFDGKVSAFDALAVLKSAVGSRYCALAVCDTTNDGATTATDASLVLRAAVGLDVLTSCPPSGAEVPAP